MINDKQFILSRNYYKKEGWKNIKLKTNYILSYHKKLTVVTNDDCSVVLLGNAWQVDSNRKSPQIIVQKIRGGVISIQFIILKKHGVEDML